MVRPFLSSDGPSERDRAAAPGGLFGVVGGLSFLMSGKPFLMRGKQTDAPEGLIDGPERHNSLGFDAWTYGPARRPCH